MTGLIAHDWIESFGGAETVLDAFAELYPDAPIVCAWNDAGDRFGADRVHESWLARTPLRHHKALALPFMLSSWRHLPVKDADWILCSSHLFAHHARLAGAARDVPKYVFAHTPARYIWEPELDERGSGLLTRAVSRPLRRIDRARAQEAEKIAAVSRFIANRIDRDWGRESTVIYPPVDVATFDRTGTDDLTVEETAVLERLPTDYLFGASRFVPYKRLDTVILAGAACDLPVVIAGDGPDRARLAAAAEQHRAAVTFISRPSTPMLRELYRRAVVYVFPPVEDFGIMPVEAMAAGTPVVANAIGGASETVVDGRTGAHFRSTRPEELRRAVEAAAGVSREQCRARAWEFDRATFGARITQWMG